MKVLNTHCGNVLYAI